MHRGYTQMGRGPSRERQRAGSACPATIGRPSTLDLINATNRANAGQLEPSLAYDPASPLDQPRLVVERSQAIPFLPSVGVRFRF